MGQGNNIKSDISFLLDKLADETRRFTQALRGFGSKNEKDQYKASVDYLITEITKNKLSVQNYNSKNNSPRG